MSVLRPVPRGGSVATDTIWDAKGDLAVGTGPDTAARLSVGGEGTSLRVRSGTPAWEVAPISSGGRLSASSTESEPTSDIATTTAVYYHEFGEDGNRLTVFDASDAPITLAFSGVQTINLGTLTASKIYSVYAYNNSGTLAFELGAAWSNDTTPEALAKVCGVRVKNADHTRRLVGAFRTVSTTQTAWTAANRAVANEHNLRIVDLFLCPGYANDNSITSYTTTATSWAEANGGTGSRGYLLTLHPVLIALALTFRATNSGATGYNFAGVGVDSVAVCLVHSASYSPTGSSADSGPSRGIAVSAGYHYCALLICVSAGTGTFYADGGRSFGETVDLPRTYFAGTYAA